MNQNQQVSAAVNVPNLQGVTFSLTSGNGGPSGYHFTIKTETHLSNGNANFTGS